MGLLFILLSTACSLAIAQVLKKARHNNLNLMQILVVNYITAVCISLLLNPDHSSYARIDFPLLGLAAVMGFIFIANLFIYSASLHHSGMGISIAAMRISLVIPVGVSIFVYGELIDTTQWVGVMLVFPSLVLLLPKVTFSKMDDFRDAAFPVLLFIMTGIADTSMKIYERMFSVVIPEYTFLSLIFICSFLFGILALFNDKKFRFSKRTIGYGIAAGIANLYSSFFLLRALAHLSGSLVFSLVNILNVIFGALIGYLVWKDTLTSKQKAGLVVATISILLLIG